jgi:tetratricopeptide (TPR) repeat protein/transcriptional regulator with XRE-family HTH domain
MPDPLRLAVLADLRQSAHITLEEMARACGLSSRSGRESVSAWEQGRSVPHPRRRARFITYLAGTLGLSGDPQRLRAIWETLVEEWEWAPLSDAEWHLIVSDAAAQIQPALEAARALLAAMPGDQGAIPPPAPLPPGSRVLFQRNPLFVGRTADLRALAGALHQGQALAIGQAADQHPSAGQATVAPGNTAVTGIGGMGKTQLAVEFVYRYGQFFAGGVFWINCADPSAITTEIAACGGDGALALTADFAELPLDMQVQLVTEAWHSPMPRLLVFDNCEDPALVARWRPTRGGCRVLITSRRPGWEAALGIRLWPLSPLSRRESIMLLRELGLALPIEAPVLAAIAAELGDLPLALHLAGSFLARRAGRPSPEGYLSQLRTPAARRRASASTLATVLRHPSLQQQGQTPTGHIEHVIRTFALSYDQLRRADPIDRQACTLLACASHFAPGEPIPRSLLLSAGQGRREARGSAARLDHALQRLIDLGLIEIVASEESSDRAAVVRAVRAHRLVVGFTRIVSSDADAQLSVERAMIAEATRLSDERLPAPILAFQVHMRAVTEAARSRRDAQAARLCALLGWHLTLLSAYAGARPFLQESIDILAVTVGPAHPDMAGSLNMLGLLYQWEGDLASAVPCFERARAIWEDTLNPQHHYVAVALNNLGLVLTERGAYEPAHQSFRRALGVCLQSLGAEHPTTLRTRTNLGRLFTFLGLFAEAQAELEQALALRALLLPANHPSLAQTLANLGELHRAQGRHEAAWQHHQQAYTIRSGLYGTRHSIVAESLGFLGAVLYDQQRAPEALGYLEQALTINETLLGPEHIETAQVLDLLGQVYGALGEDTRASQAFRRAYAVYARQLVPEHAALRRLRALQAPAGASDQRAAHP